MTYNLHNIPIHENLRALLNAANRAGKSAVQLAAMVMTKSKQATSVARFSSSGPNLAPFLAKSSWVFFQSTVYPGPPNLLRFSKMQRDLPSGNKKYIRHGHGQIGISGFTSRLARSDCEVNEGRAQEISFLTKKKEKSRFVVERCCASRSATPWNTHRMQPEDIDQRGATWLNIIFLGRKRRNKQSTKPFLPSSTSVAQSVSLRGFCTLAKNFRTSSDEGSSSGSVPPKAAFSYNLICTIGEITVKIASLNRNIPPGSISESNMFDKGLDNYIQVHYNVAEVWIASDGRPAGGPARGGRILSFHRREPRRVAFTADAQRSLIRLRFACRGKNQSVLGSGSASGSGLVKEQGQCHKQDKDSDQEGIRTVIRIRVTVRIRLRVLRPGSVPIRFIIRLRVVRRIRVVIRIRIRTRVRIKIRMRPANELTLIKPTLITIPFSSSSSRLREALQLSRLAGLWSGDGQYSHRQLRSTLPNPKRESSRTPRSNAPWTFGRAGPNQKGIAWPTPKALLIYEMISCCGSSSAVVIPDRNHSPSADRLGVSERASPSSYFHINSTASSSRSNNPLATITTTHFGATTALDEERIYDRNQLFPLEPLNASMNRFHGILAPRL
ncbi:unnamed protein product [Nesidiocoris tenuis]|uniref:Uncharacterized protein n=1 Tax=Nesidiocoris tenuis TaxID=355587 RepID=A0A6H5HI05_9HEMI|nr:unnamed protein product [Nesidiocoris tenuis]